MLREITEAEKIENWSDERIIQRLRSGHNFDDSHRNEIICEALIRILQKLGDIRLNKRG